MTFIVAEVGSNYQSLEDCLDSISMAKAVGADACKFQMFNHGELYGLCDHNPACESPIKAWLPQLRIQADAVGIELACTAFSPEGVDYVDQFVKRHKVASAELSYGALLERVRGTNKPVLLSTGASSLSDVGLALRVLDGSNVTLLYCVAAYPAKDVNLYGIDMLRREFGKPVGYSCHTTDISTPVSAVHNHQATTIEKHFKIREMNTPDNAHSLNILEFKQMVRQIRGNPIDHVIFPTQQEEDMLTKHNRRLIVTKAVEPGEALEYGVNFGVYRSLKDSDTRGITGFAWDKVNGKTYTHSLGVGEPIGPGDFK